MWVASTYILTDTASVSGLTVLLIHRLRLTYTSEVTSHANFKLVIKSFHLWAGSFELTRSYHVLGDVIATFQQQNALINGQYTNIGATMSVDRQR